MRGEKELLTKQIVEEYQRRAMLIKGGGGEDTGQRRILRNELMELCGITEIEAMNILNGYHVNDYIHKYEVKSGKLAVAKDASKQSANRKLLEELAEMETKLRQQEMFEKELS